MYHIVKERQPVLFHTLPFEFDAAFYRIKVFHEGIYLLGFDLDPGVLHNNKYWGFPTRKLKLESLLA